MFDGVMTIQFNAINFQSYIRFKFICRMVLYVY